MPGCRDLVRDGSCLTGVVLASWAVACGPEPGGETSQGPGSEATQSADTDGATAQGPAPTSGGSQAPDPTSGGSGTSTPQGSSTGDISTGPAEDTGSTGTTTSEPYEPLMCRRPAFVSDACPTALSAATAIEGAGGTLTVATFGVSVEACVPGNNFNGLAFGDPAEPTVFIYGWPGEHRCGPETWLGAHVTTAYLVGDQPDSIELMVTLTIEGFAGDWDNEAPQEPTRIFGQLSGDLVGPFEAVRCDVLDRLIDNCG